MKEFPHHYPASARGGALGDVTLSSPGLPDLLSDGPREFGGSGERWSPETMLSAAVADCFILTFRAVARAARFEWQGLECETEGTLERVEGVTAFTRYVTRATLTVAPGADAAKARELLERSEKACLIANSLRGERSLTISIVESAAA